MFKFNVLYGFLFGIASIFAQGIKIVGVNPGTDQITLKNFGTDMVEITNHRFCALFQYAGDLTGLTVDSGSLELAVTNQPIADLEESSCTGILNHEPECPLRGGDIATGEPKRNTQEKKTYVHEAARAIKTGGSEFLMGLKELVRREPATSGLNV